MAGITISLWLATQIILDYLVIKPTLRPPHSSLMDLFVRLFPILAAIA
jgi:hypothetical protein